MSGVFIRQGNTRKATGSPFAPAKAKGRAFKPRPLPRSLDDVELPAGQRVVVEYPPAILNPNARAHWSKKNKAARAYRKSCWALALQAKIAAPEDGLIRLRLDFFPPDGSAPDDDNVIADALKVDDARFRIMPVMRRERRSCVVVTIISEGEVCHG